MSEQPNSKTMEVLFDFLKDAPERQIDNAGSLDSKMVNIFSAASIVIGLAGLSGGDSKQTTATVTVLLIMGLIAYAATAYIAFKHLRPRQWHRSLNVDEWWRLLWNRTEDEARHSILSNLAQNYALNKPLLESKARTIRLALATTGGEVVLVGLALISLQAS